MSNPIDNGGPAFPCASSIDGTGMTIRDWMAGRFAEAMVAGYAHPDARIEIEMSDQEIGQKIAIASYRFADAMITERRRAQ